MSSAEVEGFSPRAGLVLILVLMLPHTHRHTHTHQKGTKGLITYVIEVSGENRTGFPSETEVKKK